MIVTKHWWIHTVGHDNEQIALGILFKRWKNIGWRIEVLLWRSCWRVERYHLIPEAYRRGFSDGIRSVMYSRHYDWPTNKKSLSDVDNP